MKDLVELLKMRAAITNAIRDFFVSRGFLEVETPLLVRLPGQEPYLHPMPVAFIDATGSSWQAFLHTSPEYCMKKLVARGTGNIFQVCKTFRNKEEWGGLHNPEFTMLEWYRVNADYCALMTDVEELFNCVLWALGSTEKYTWQRVTMKKLWEEYVSIDLDTCLTVEGLKSAVSGLGFSIGKDESYEDLFFRAFLNFIEPKLVQPTIVYEYPAPLASLSRLSPKDNRYAERFEVYCSGMEIANAFSELIDAKEQRTRLVEEREKRALLGAQVFAIDETFVDALHTMPETAGCALGVDRLIMAIIGCKNIDEILPFSASHLFDEKKEK